MSEVAMFLVLVGPPGSGKGTQAEQLSERLGVPAISTGEMVRAAVASRSELGQRVDEIINTGELVDDLTMGDLVRARLEQHDAQSGFLLDGYPRTLSQAETLDAIMDQAGKRLGGVVLIDVPEEELVRRMMGRGRPDDKEDVIRRRLAVYRERTKPLVDHYRKLDLLIEVDGDQSVEAVQEEIVRALGVDSLVSQKVDS